MKDWLKSIGFIENNKIFKKDNLIINIVDIFESEEGTNYYEKYLQYKSNNKHLILMYSDECKNKQIQYQNYIKSIVGLYQKKVYARKCEIKEIGKRFAMDFIEDHHIQGSNNLGIIFFGLLLDGELLGVISLGRHHRDVNIDKFLVLDRLCFKNGVQVVGGASKLLNACIRWATDRKYENIISFSDNRWSLGKIYSVLGFELEKEYKSDYFYVDKKVNIRLSKQSQQKKKVNCPEEFTEYEWAKHKGLIRIWDCGKKRWNYKLNPKEMTYKEMLSRKCSLQHANGVFKHSHIRGYFYSIKNNDNIYYSSSYELRCLYMLEHDNNIKSFSRCHIIPTVDKKWRNPDILVECNDNSLGIIEVKPLKRCNGENEIKQISESRDYAKANNYFYKVWTELDSGLNSEKEIIAWAKKNNNTGIEFDILSKEKHNKRQKKYYKNKVQSDKITIWCGFCNENHQIMNLSYNLNIEKNGRYICIKENGYLVGKKPKRKIDPLFINGKKQCNKCKKIKLIFEFNLDKSRTSGLCNICRECNQKRCLEHYKKKNKKE